MADEQNKNLNNNQNTVSNQAESGRTPQAVGKLPLGDDPASDSPRHNVEGPDTTRHGGGRKGNISVEDGGPVDGASTGSR